METIPPETIPPVDSGPRRLPIFALGAVLLLICGAVSALVISSLQRESEAPTEEATVAYILDVSPRMAATANRDNRLEIARGVLAEVVRRADSEYSAGLRVFGTDVEATDCEDTEVLVPFAKANRDRMATRFTELRVGESSESALGEAMIRAIRDLEDTAGPRYMVVVTGGPDSCNQDAGRLISAEAERAGINLQTFLIGFQLSPQESEALRRVAEQIAGGRYFEAANAEELRRLLESIQGLIERGEPIALEDLAGLAPTAVPGEASQEPTREPPIADSTEAALDYESQTACDHPYFPMREGAHWDYSYDGLPATWDVTQVTGDRSAATATVVMVADPVTLTYHWDCGTEGILYFQSGFSAEMGENVEVVMTSYSGSPIPPPGAFLPGSTWTSAYTTETRVESEGFPLTLTNQVEETFTAGDLEQRIIDGVDVQVIPISTSSTSVTTVQGNSFTNTSSGTCWFGLGIGWLGCELVSAGESSVIELIGYSIP